jgi:hypothetical protein
VPLAPAKEVNVTPGTKMTKKLFYDPQHWHERAEDARKVAAEILDPISRRAMLDIAESYESLARL